jgi:signal transduction histidine kinase
LVVVIVAVLSTWFAWRTYRTHTDAIVQDLKSQTDRLEDTFQDILEYTEHLMSYIAQQVILFSDDGMNLEYINDVLSSYRIVEKDVLSWNTFSWADANHNIRVSSNGRAMQTPYHSLARRDYIPFTITQPGKLHIGSPAYGILTHQWSVPLGYGVRNRAGEYLGAVVTGLIMASLENKLESAINVPGVSFHMVDKGYKTAAESPLKRRPLPPEVLQTLIEKENQNQMSGMLSTSLPFHRDNGFIYYRSFPNHPYSFIVSYDKNLSDQRIWHTMLSYIYEFTAIGFLVIMLLYVFRQRIILPIAALSDVAVRIARGEEISALPAGSSVEIDNLIMQMQKVISYTHELRDTQTRLENANKLFSAALGYMAHELKTPLNLIIGFSEMLMNEIVEKVGDKTKEYLTLIFEAGQHQHKLINTFLKTAEYQKGINAMERTEVVLLPLLEKQIAMASNLSKEMGVTLSLRSLSEHIPTMMLDEIKIGQAFQNFITNGIKYNTVGGHLYLTVSIRESLPTEQILGSMQQLVVVFQDTGIGIEADQYDHVFERFARLAISEHHAIEGSGLGLPYAKEIVELHGGSIAISSTVGEGTSFTVSLPIILAEQPKQSEALPTPE